MIKHGGLNPDRESLHLLFRGVGSMCDLNPGIVLELPLASYTTTQASRSIPTLLKHMRLKFVNGLRPQLFCNLAGFSVRPRRNGFSLHSSS
jgi:hypothetical protein